MKHMKSRKMRIIKVIKPALITVLLFLSSVAFTKDILTEEDVLRLELADKKAHQLLDAQAVLKLAAPDFVLTHNDGTTVSMDSYAVTIAQQFDLILHLLSKRKNHSIEISRDKKTATLIFDQNDKIMFKKNRTIYETNSKVKMEIGIFDGVPKMIAATIIKV